MKISFIITYYNEPADMLLECIDSILALPIRRDEREIILVDDGSQQSPMTSLEDYKDSINYIYQQNQGLSVARNTGIWHSTGDYIQFVDSDDSLIVKGYEHVLELLRSEVPDMVMFRFATSKQDIHSSSECKCYSGAEYLALCNLRPAACAYTFRRAMLGTLRFKPGIYHEDELFTPILLLQVRQVYVILSTAYFYRQHESTITHTTDKEKIQRRLNDTHDNILAHSIMLQQLHDIERQGMQRIVAQLTMTYLYNTMKLTHSITELCQRSHQLRDEGLIPLPLKCYTVKYLIFAALTHIFR